MNTVVKLHGVHKSFNGKTVLDGISFEVEKKSIFTILGPSGAGKSVTLRNIVGLLTPDSGEIEVFGKMMAECDKKKLSAIRRKIGFIFQDGALLNSLTLFDNVALPLREHYGALGEQEIKKRVKEVLESVGLVDSLDKMPSEMSGGMRKRAALARSLVTKPELILYDEPTSGLDPVMVTIVNKLIKKARDEFDVTSILVTHDIPSAFSISDKIGVFLRGKIVLTGTPEEVKACNVREVCDFLEGKDGQ